MLLSHVLATAAVLWLTGFWNWLFHSVFFEWKKDVNFFIIVFDFFSNWLYC